MFGDGGCGRLYRSEDLEDVDQICDRLWELHLNASETEESESEESEVEEVLIDDGDDPRCNYLWLYIAIP